MKIPHIVIITLLACTSAGASDRPTAEALAKKYLAAVQNHDAQAIRNLIAPAAYQNRTNEQRDYIEKTWVQSAFHPRPDAPTAAAVRVRPWEASHIRVQPDWKWPITPTSVIEITHQTKAGHSGTVLAAVAVDGQFFIVGPLPPQ